MSQYEHLADALYDLKESLHADGADLALDGVCGGVAQIRLIVGPETCLGCIVPKEVLESVVLVALRKHDQSISGVAVVDPRSPTCGGSDSLIEGIDGRGIRKVVWNGGSVEE